MGSYFYTDNFENVVAPGFFKEFSRKKGRSNEDEQKSVRELNRLYMISSSLQTSTRDYKVELK